MRAILLILLSTFVLSCRTMIQTNYPGSDVGYAVIGIGVTLTKDYYPDYDFYTFEFRRAGGKAKGSFEYYPSSFRSWFMESSRDSYKSSDEAGIVAKVALPPGHYELVNFRVSSIPVFLHSVCSSHHDFSIPFEIKPGQVVYLGNYQARRMSKIAETHDERCVFFIVEDRFATDLALAKTRVTSLPIENALDATPDVEKIGNRYLVSPEQAMRAREAVDPEVQSSPAKGSN